MGDNTPKSLIESLHELSKTLGLATDDLNEALKQAEEMISRLHLGVTAEVALRMEGGCAQLLIFGKRDQAWGLYFYDGPFPRTSLSGLEEIPLRSASRAARIRAAHYLPELFEALLREAREQVSIIQETTEKVRAFVRGLKGEDA
jgi:hypothetical protein